jgi:hypothetical protein
MRARVPVPILLLLVAFAAGPADAGRQGLPSDREALRVARHVQRALGGREAWDRTRYLAWSFFGRRSHVWDRQTGAWINDSYWLLMPYKLTDPGVRLRHLGTRALPDGEQADVLGLTFSAVGLTPQNRYEVLVNARTRLVERWLFFSNASDSEARFDRPFSGWQRRGEILLPDHGNGWDSSVLRVVPSAVFEELRPMTLEVVRGLSRLAGDSGAAPRPLQGLVPGPPQRIVAVGDVHGDLGSAREALRLAGAIDAGDNWIGGRMIVVQVGDQLDRGDQEREVLELFERLRSEARAAGGAFHPLLGNHETMNVRLDFRYVTEGGWKSFADLADPDDGTLAEYPLEQRGRVAAFRPGGPYAKILASHDVVRIVGDTVFVHGGLLLRHAELGVDEINGAVRAWMLGETERPEVLTTRPSPVWSREYSMETDADDCEELGRVLALLDVDRMVVAHTVQEKGITSACDERVWRVDVGLADHYGGETSVLEIVGDSVRVLR